MPRKAFPRGADHGLAQPAPGKLAHAVGHRALTGNHDAIGGSDLGRRRN
jgi:hypothetical protein